MSRTTSTFQAWLAALWQGVDARLPQQARWITRLPKWAWGCAALAAILLAGRVVGAGPQAEAQSAQPDTTLLALDALAKLGIVLGLFFVGVYALRRWRSVLPGRQERKLALLETMRLSQRQSLHLVQVGGQTLLIGATDQGISLLTRVESSAPVQPPADFYAEFLRQQGAPENYFDFSNLAEPEIR